MKSQLRLLSILRHAKSSWKDSSLDDHDRPLNKRGRRDAPRMGRLMREEGLIPDLILCSTARRARNTAERAGKKIGDRVEIRFLRELYLGAPEAYVEVASQLPDEVAHVLMVGHNPGLEELLASLVGESHRLPTAALAVVELPIARWRQILQVPRGRLRRIWLPRELAES